MIRVRSKWRRVAPIPALDDASANVCRVMGTVEGWVVARFKGAVPFVMYERDWRQHFKPVKPEDCPTDKGAAQ